MIIILSTSPSNDLESTSERSAVKYFTLLKRAVYDLKKLDILNMVTIRFLNTNGIPEETISHDLQWFCDDVPHILFTRFLPANINLGIVLTH